MRYLNKIKILIYKLLFEPIVIERNGFKATFIHGYGYVEGKAPVTIVIEKNRIWYAEKKNYDEK